MFDFTGVARVATMASNHFLDGAIADHLTSFGGVLHPAAARRPRSSGWTVGATGSYGTSSEPCNFRGKFPEVGVVMAHYLAGETLLEAYWKSVLMPGQGVFVGDPLARPFGGVRVSRTADQHGDRDPRAAAGQLLRRGVEEQLRAVPGDRRGARRRLRDSQDHVAGGGYAVLPVARSPGGPEGGVVKVVGTGLSTLQSSADTGRCPLRW